MSENCFDVSNFPTIDLLSNPTNAKLKKMCVSHMCKDAFFADSQLGCGRRKSFPGRSLRLDWLGEVMRGRQDCLDLVSIPPVTIELTD